MMPLASSVEILMTGAQIKTLREQMGLSQRELAQAFGVDVGTVSRWERSVQVPPRYVELALAELQRRERKIDVEKKRVRASRTRMVLA